jgi:hypothetical protein
MAAVPPSSPLSAVLTSRSSVDASSFISVLPHLTPIVPVAVQIERAALTALNRNIIFDSPCKIQVLQQLNRGEALINQPLRALAAGRKTTPRKYFYYLKSIA